MPPSWCNAQPHLDPVHGNEGPEAFDVVVAEEQAAGECFVTWKPGMRKGVANSKRICSSYVGGLETSRDAHTRKGKTRDMVAPACTDSKSAFSYGFAMHPSQRVVTATASAINSRVLASN